MQMRPFRQADAIHLLGFHFLTMVGGIQLELIGRQQPLTSADVTYQFANLLEPSVIQDRSVVRGWLME